MTIREHSHLSLFTKSPIFLTAGFVCLGAGCGPARPYSPSEGIEPTPKRDLVQSTEVSPAMRLGLKVVRVDGVSNTQISVVGNKMETNGSQISIRGHLNGLEAFPNKLVFVWSENALGSPIVQIQVQHVILNGNNKWTYEKPSDLAIYDHRNRTWFVSISDLIGTLSFHEADTHLMILDFLLGDQTRDQIEVRFRVRGFSSESQKSGK